MSETAAAAISEAREAPTPPLRVVPPNDANDAHWRDAGPLWLRTLRALNVPGRLWARLLLSRAKYPSLGGHPRIALRLSRWVKGYRYAESELFSLDGAPGAVVQRRRDGLAQLSRTLTSRAEASLALSRTFEADISDVAFVNAYRVPFQFRRLVQERLPLPCVAERTDGAKVVDLDGNASYDLGGAYGVNLFGVDFYRRCIDRGVERARELGLALGPYHPVIADNVRRLKAICGLDEVSFHMSGTEAVMQAVRLARYHTGRSHVVKFTGSYHGWWDGVQTGPGNPRPAREVYTLSEMSDATLRALEARHDVACVLVNALQAMSPNQAPPADSMLIASDRSAHYDRAAYTRWLEQLRALCTRKRIVLIFDEVFLGFRLALGGVQEYFGVRADLVTYGKTLGGGLPVGALCGRRELMRRFRDDAPADICFARGTFNSHPYVMATMNEFLRALDEPQWRATYDGLDARWSARAALLNERLMRHELPVRVENMTSIFTTLYAQPGRYNWLLQYYLRAAGLAMSWIGTGRFIFSHDLSDRDYEGICDAFVAGAQRMRDDGWLWKGAEDNRAIRRSVLKELVSARLRA